MSMKPMNLAPKPCWNRRWAMIRAVLAFLALLGGYVAVFGPDDRLRETALMGAFGLAGAVVLGYLGFATQDDSNWMSTLAAKPTSRPRTVARRES